MDCGCTSGISDKDFNEMTEEEKTYLNKLVGLYHFIQVDDEISDWSTKNIGTFFVRTIVEHPSLGFEEIDDLFTPQIGNVSWPDIAMMYNLKDFRVLTKTGNELNTPAKYTEPEPCEIYDPYCSFGSQASKRYSSFQSCFNEVVKNHPSDRKATFRKEDKVEKTIQSSPCQYLEKFKNCSEYCTWHKNFLGTIGEDEFIQAMIYASPQRKLYKESMPREKKIAGKVEYL